MPFITDRKRENYIKDINASYAVRKAIIFVTIVLTIAFIVMTILSFYKWIQIGAQQVSFGDEEEKSALEVLQAQTEQWMSWFKLIEVKEGEELVGYTFGLSQFGIGMVIWAGLVAAFGIASIILTFTIRSPRAISEKQKKLGSAALSGKKTAGQSHAAVVRARAGGR